MFGMSLVNSLATWPRLNDALRSAAERLAVQELPALASVLTERHLMLPAFLVARWQTTYPMRTPVLEQQWQRQAAKWPRPAFPA